MYLVWHIGNVYLYYYLVNNCSRMCQKNIDYRIFIYNWFRSICIGKLLEIGTFLNGSWGPIVQLIIFCYIFAPKNLMNFSTYTFSTSNM